MREAQAWQEIETQRAKQRQKEHGGTAPGKTKTLKENFPEVLDKGQTRDKLAERVGFGSGRTYEKAAWVVAVIDEEEKG